MGGCQTSRARSAGVPDGRTGRPGRAVACRLRWHLWGAPRIRVDLSGEGRQVSVKTVANPMRAAGIQGISPRSWRPVTTRSGDDETPAPDLVGRLFDQGGLNLAWFSGITYLAYGHQ